MFSFPLHGKLLFKSGYFVKTILHVEKKSFRHDIQKRFEDKQKLEEECRGQRLCGMMAAKQYRTDQQTQKKKEEAEYAAKKQVCKLNIAEDFLCMSAVIV